MLCYIAAFLLAVLQSQKVTVRDTSHISDTYVVHFVEEKLNALPGVSETL